MSLPVLDRPCTETRADGSAKQSGTLRLFIISLNQFCSQRSSLFIFFCRSFCVVPLCFIEYSRFTTAVVWCFFCFLFFRSTPHRNTPRWWGTSAPSGNEAMHLCVNFSSFFFVFLHRFFIFSVFLVVLLRVFFASLSFSFMKRMCRFSVFFLDRPRTERNTFHEWRTSAPSGCGRLDNVFVRSSSYCSCSLIFLIFFFVFLSFFFFFCFCAYLSFSSMKRMCRFPVSRWTSPRNMLRRWGTSAPSDFGWTPPSTTRT